MDCKLYVLLSEEIGSNFRHMDDGVAKNGLRIWSAQDFLSILAKENVTVQRLVAFGKCFEPTVAIRSSIFKAFVSHLLRLFHALHSYLIWEIFTLVKIRSAQYLGKTFKCFIYIPIQESCLNEYLFISVVYITMILCVSMFINADFQSIGGIQQFIVEDVVLVILGTDLVQKLLEHWHEDSVLLWETL